MTDLTDDHPGARRYALSDGRSRRARIGAALTGVVVLAIIWTACAALRDDATQKLAARAAGAAGGTGLAAHAAGALGRGTAHPQSHFLEFIMISTGVVAIGILVAFMSTDVLADRLRLVRGLLEERQHTWDVASGQHAAAVSLLRRLVGEQRAAGDSVGRVAEIAQLQARVEIELRATAQHDLTGYWSPSEDADRAVADAMDTSGHDLPTMPDDLLTDQEVMAMAMDDTRDLPDPDDPQMSRARSPLG